MIRTLPFCVVALSMLQASGTAAQPATSASAGTPAKDPIEGFWFGTVTSPQGRAEMGFQFRRTPKGQLVALAFMPVMHLFGAPVSYVRPSGNEYVLEQLETRATRTEDTLRGTYAHAGLPFELRRVEKFPDVADVIPSFAAGPDPAWSRALGAPIWGSPVARDGVLYVDISDGSVRALRTRDGKTLWTWAGRVPLYGDPLVTPDALYAVSERSELVKLRRTDGHLLWTLPLQPVAPVDAATPAPDDTYNHRTPVPVLEQGVLYVGSGDGGFHAVEAATGKKIWRFDAGARVCAAAAVHGERVFFGAFDGTIFALDRRIGAELWRMKTGGPVVSSPFVHGDTVVVGSRDFILYALRTADGREVWRQPFWGSWIESTPRLAGGTLYVGSSDLRHVRALDPATGNPIWSTDIFGSAWGTPLVVGNTVWMGSVGVKDYMIRHEASLVALERRTGRIKWRRVMATGENPMCGIAGSLASSGGKVFAAGLDGTLAAFPTGEDSLRPGGAPGRTR
jgi:outer membrane protein assembly factor BamB